jgi:hypothetical protein
LIEYEAQSDKAKKLIRFLIEMMVTKIRFPPAGRNAPLQMSRTASGGAPGSPIAAGAVYFALVFALGFVLGTARTFFVHDAPGTSRLIGVLIELPIMLGASWFLCLGVVRRLRVAPAIVPRAAMGGVALALLLLAEWLVGALLLGRAPSEHVALYRDPSYALGLAAQLGFGLMPLMQLRQGK